MPERTYADAAFDFYIGIIYFHDMCSICILSVNLYCLPFSIRRRRRRTTPCIFISDIFYVYLTCSFQTSFLFNTISWICVFVCVCVFFLFFPSFTSLVPLFFFYLYIQYSYMVVFLIHHVPNQYANKMDKDDFCGLRKLYDSKRFIVLYIPHIYKIR